MPVVQQRHYVYTVQPGDTLYSIAQRYFSSVQAIENANAIYPPYTERGLIHPGQMLLIPTSYEETLNTLYVIKPGDTLYGISQQFSTHFELLAALNYFPDPNLIYVGQVVWLPVIIHEVASGDTLFKLSQQYGIPLTDITLANETRPFFSPDLLRPGYRLIVPLPSSRNILVTHPLPGEAISGSVRATGYARIFEANVLTQVVDDQGNVVAAEQYTTASEGAPAYGYFNTTVPLTGPPQTANGWLWVYSRSARDNSIQDLVQVRLQFTT